MSKLHGRTKSALTVAAYVGLLVIGVVVVGYLVGSFVPPGYRSIIKWTLIIFAILTVTGLGRPAKSHKENGNKHQNKPTEDTPITHNIAQDPVEVEGNESVSTPLPSFKPLPSFNVGNSPYGVAFDGANIWVTNYWAHTVTKLRASDGDLQGTFAVGNGPTGVAFDGANIWVANEYSNTVSRL